MSGEDSWDVIKPALGCFLRTRRQDSPLRVPDTKASRLHTYFPTPEPATGHLFLELQTWGPEFTRRGFW